MLLLMHKAPGFAASSAFAGFLVLGAHVLAGLGQGLDRGVEINAVARRDLIGGDHEGHPGFHRAERAALDARDLHIAGDRVAGHAKVMFERGFGGVLGDLRRTVHHLRDERSRHGGSHADFGLAATFGSGKCCIVLAQVTDRCTSEQPCADFSLESFRLLSTSA